MKNKFQIINGIALVVTIVMNYLSNTGIFNGATMATVSAKYQNFFTPSGYAFSIWGLIYLGLLGFVLHYGVFVRNTAAKEKAISGIGWWFLVTCLANSLWVVAWLYEYTLLSVLIMVVLLVALLNILESIRVDMPDPELKTKLFLKWPFQIYTGWISVALIANVAAFLEKVEWNGFGSTGTTWAIVMIIVAALVHLFMIWKRQMPVFALVAVWALIAIAVANRQSNDEVYISAVAAAVFVFANIIFFTFRRKAV